MSLADLFNECYAVEFDNPESGADGNVIRVFAVHFYATECSLRETHAITRVTRQNAKCYEDSLAGASRY